MERDPAGVWTERRETPLSHSFCQYTVARGEPLVIEDARVHPLVRENLAIPDLRVVAYAGVPLTTSADVEQLRTVLQWGRTPPAAPPYMGENGGRWCSWRRILRRCGGWPAWCWSGAGRAERTWRQR